MKVKNITPDMLVNFIESNSLEFNKKNLYGIAKKYVYSKYKNPSKNQIDGLRYKLEKNYEQISYLLNMRSLSEGIEHEATEEEQIKATEQTENAVETQIEATEETQLENEVETQIEATEETQLENAVETQIEATEETQLENSVETHIEATEETQLENAVETQIEATKETQLETLEEVYRKIEGIPETFEITIKNSQAYDSLGNFSCSIQNLLYGEFFKVNYACPLRFEKKRIKKEGYCKITNFTAKCLFTTCCNYKFLLSNQNENNTTFLVNQIGTLKHLTNEIQRRQIRGDLRKKL